MPYDSSALRFRDCGLGKLNRSAIRLKGTTLKLQRVMVQGYLVQQDLCTGFSLGFSYICTKQGCHVEQELVKGLGFRVWGGGWGLGLGVYFGV